MLTFKVSLFQNTKLLQRKIKKQKTKTGPHKLVLKTFHKSCCLDILQKVL